MLFASLQTLNLAIKYLYLNQMMLTQLISSALLIGLLLGGWFIYHQIMKVALVYNYYPEV
jgi:hypothetical protein